MLPINYQPKTPEKKEYELLPDDIYEAEITRMEFKENEPVYQKEGEVEDKLEFEFTLTEEGQYKGRKMWQRTRIIMSPGSNGYSPSWLYKLFCAVNKVILTDDEAKQVTAASINDLLHKRVRLVVKSEPNKKGVIKNKIKDMLPTKASSDGVVPNVMLVQEQAVDDINVEDIPF